MAAQDVQVQAQARAQLSQESRRCGGDPVQGAASASLYVGDLHPEVSEGDLVSAFREMGDIASVRVCRDGLSGSSLCYGYVNFFSHCHASKALACLNHSNLKGKPIRVMWCRRDPSQRKAGIANLFVKNLDPSISSAWLQSIFCQYGEILSCKVAEENGKSKGFGFVQFDTEESAMNALRALHNTMLEGKKIYVSKFVRKGDRESEFTNLYVKNFGEDVTVDHLQEMFSMYGTVSNVVIMKNDEGKSRGFGFVNFESPVAAKKAVDSLNGKKMGSKSLFVGRAQKKAEREELLKEDTHKEVYSHNVQKNVCNLYVKNLDLSIDDSKLQEYFSSFGKITSAKVMRENTGLSKGFGFVCFSTSEEANRALKTLNGTIFRGKSLYLALAQKKEDRLQENTTSFQTQSWHQSNWDALPGQYFPNPYSFPFFNLSHTHFTQSLPYHYVRTDASLPYKAENYLQNYSAYVPGKHPQTQHNNAKTWVYGHNSMIFSNSSLDARYQSCYKPGAPRLGSGKRGNKKILPVEKTSAGLTSASRTRCLTDPYYQGTSRGSLEDILYPLVENIQPEQAANITGMLLEMSDSDIKKLISSPNSLSVQVNEADRLLKEANTSTMASNSAVLPKSARCLNY